ncbi:MAG: hypothetical protein SNF33_02410 [Candidatus Algichlamydia australiensis]|nr:hypothetical protein [Chlamydiales bacterium]
MKKIFLFSLFLLGSLLADKVVLSLGQLGSVHYFYDDDCLSLISRVSPEGKIIYSHSYEYDSSGKLLSENLIGNLGQVYYDNDCLIHTPFGIETCEYDDQHNLKLNECKTVL